eukprot:CAMPEP_0201486102 /NCGR_PEP_ID=MMETSP0151_2-20130828/10166_1 /ASSEMBLY_ACC=CAM_ASM_000257 /TAXON_ID=200890 /ORGANISM="Paramoeba atlantica, Strain 621/1 / CCAP 1560/9" /LENGTH=198 /DNA_ID=CAMNT_0047870545 /DNA_START=53 /DNA_END=649 /DNA_ORIENTATION=-
MIVSPPLLHFSDAPQPPLKSSKTRNVELPDEYNLVRFIANITNPHASWTTHNKQWDGAERDLKGATRVIDWFSRGLSGTLQWEYLPRSLKELNFYDNKLYGSVDLVDLPPGLVVLDLSYNRFSGSLELTKLPETMEELILSENQFAGWVDLNRLPRRLSTFAVRNNAELTGKLEPEKLPRDMSYRALWDTKILVCDLD